MQSKIPQEVCHASPRHATTACVCGPVTRHLLATGGSLAWAFVSFGPGALRGARTALPGEVDYRLARQAVLAEFRKGRLAQHEICDAHPELMRAARECSEPTGQRCPVCEVSDLVLVTYVFGPRLPAHGRCITSRAELRSLAKRRGDLACYVVEVCPECSWNHLARTFVLNPARSV